MDFSRFSIMSITEILDRTFDIHKKNIGTSALYMFVLSIISIVVGLIFVFVGMVPLTMIMGSISMLGYGASDVQVFIWIAVMFVVLGVVFYAIELVRQSGVIIIGSNGFLKKKTDIGNAMEGMFRNIPRMLSVILAGTLLFIPVVIVFGGVMIAFIRNYEITYSVFSLIGIIVSGLILLVWFIYFMTVHIYSAHTAIIEKLTFFKALKRSRVLVKNNFWKTLGSYVLFALVVGTVSFSIYTVLGIIAGIIYLILGSSGINQNLLTMLLMLGNILRIPIQIIISLFIGPLTGIFITILYYNQRFKKNGYDIELNLMELKNTK